MLPTYKATLKGNRLEWGEDTPEHLSPEEEVRVYVTILEEPSVSLVNVSQGERMAAALEQLASAQALAETTDPVAWEREIRQGG